MLRTLLTFVAAFTIAGCDSRSREPRPPPPAPSAEKHTPAVGLEDRREEAYETVAPERAASILEKARPADSSAAADARVRVAAPGISFESIPRSGIRGPIGAHEDAVALVANTGSAGPHAAVVYVVRRESDAWVADRLGPLGGPWRTVEIEDQFLADAHDDGDVDVFVVARFTTGTESAAAREFGATIPYVWSDGRFRYPNRLDDALTDAATTERALEILRLDGTIRR